MSEKSLPESALPAALGLAPFRPRWPWLNGDLQTLRDTLRPVALPPDQGTPVQIPVGGGDQLVALLDQPLGGTEPRALVLLMHGLGGSSCRSGLRIKRSWIPTCPTTTMKENNCGTLIGCFPALWEEKMCLQIVFVHA